MTLQTEIDYKIHIETQNDFVKSIHVILHIKNNSGDIIITTFKLYYRARDIVAKAM